MRRCPLVRPRVLSSPRRPSTTPPPITLHPRKYSSAAEPSKGNVHASPASNAPQPLARTPRNHVAHCGKWRPIIICPCQRFDASLVAAPFPRRTHHCGTLSAKHAGSKVVLSGWLLPGRYVSLQHVRSGNLGLIDISPLLSGIPSIHAARPARVSISTH